MKINAKEILNEDGRDYLVIVTSIFIFLVAFCSLVNFLNSLELTPEEMRENSFYNKCRAYSGSVWEDECISNQEVIFNLTDFDAVK